MDKGIDRDSHLLEDGRYAAERCYKKYIHLSGYKEL